jgi:hypothetical protein
VRFPEPHPGLVIRYSYLWKREQDEGLEDGSKDRPCAIVLSVLDEDEEREVLVLPITHTAPGNPDDAIEIPAPTKNRLGLDAGRSWIVITEANEFVWPGPAGSRHIDDCLWVATAEVVRTRSRQVPRARSTR